jgi:hypothetical protein
MIFDKVYRQILSELNQSTINNALLKHQTIKDKNPVAKFRSEEFSKKARNQGEKRGLMIRTILNPNSRRTADYANYYIENAVDNNGTINIKALMVDPYEDNKSKLDELEYNTNDNTLHIKREGNYREQLWLISRTDAQNLSKSIKKYTGMNVSWKNMDFISSGDYSNQYADTRYDMDKLGK